VPICAAQGSLSPVCDGEESDPMVTRYTWLLGIAAALFAIPRRLQAATRISLDQIRVSPADAGRFLGIVAPGKVAPVDGVGVPVFVDNAALNPPPGFPAILRDPSGILTLPSAPNPQSSLHLYVGGLRLVLGRDIILNGTQATPGPDQTLADGSAYLPRQIILAALEIVADWRR
jgi:hypothetical protein